VSDRPPIEPVQQPAPDKEVDPDTDPLHRKYIIQFGWGLVILAVGGLVGSVWQRYQGPSQVIITNPDTTTRLMVVQDSSQRAIMTGMLEELRAMRLGTRRERLPAASGSSDNGSSMITPSAVQVPEFKLPSVAKGYMARDLAVFARSSCGPQEYRSGTDAEISLSLRAASDTTRLSPIHVAISRRSSPSGGVEIFSQQYHLSPNSLVVFPVPTSRGSYDLEFGVFALPEVHTSYPPFYRKACKLVVI
jgi:hypothetical protein